MDKIKINWFKWNKEHQVFNHYRIFCFFGIHDWSVFHFDHSHVEGPHIVEACIGCHLLRAKKDAHE